MKLGRQSKGHNHIRPVCYEFCISVPIFYLLCLVYHSQCLISLIVEVLIGTFNWEKAAVGFFWHCKTSQRVVDSSTEQQVTPSRAPAVVTLHLLSPDLLTSLSPYNEYPVYTWHPQPTAQTISTKYLQPTTYRINLDNDHKRKFSHFQDAC